MKSFQRMREGPAGGFTRTATGLSMVGEKGRNLAEDGKRPELSRCLNSEEISLPDVITCTE